MPLNGLDVHKREIWNLSITSNPEDFFYVMDRRSGNKISYHFKFAVPDLKTARELCMELSAQFNTKPCSEFSDKIDEAANLFLAIHIYPEFNFTPKRDKINVATQQLVLNFASV